MKKLKKGDISINKKQSSCWAKNDFSIFFNCWIINFGVGKVGGYTKACRRASKVWALSLWGASAIDSVQSAAIAWGIYFQPFHTIICLHLYFLSIIQNLQLFTLFSPNYERVFQRPFDLVFEQHIHGQREILKSSDEPGPHSYVSWILWKVLDQHRARMRFLMAQHNNISWHCI